MAKHKIETTKEDSGKWTCSLHRKGGDNSIDFWEVVDEVEANSYPELMVEIGNKQFIDIINKNDKDG